MSASRYPSFIDLLLNIQGQQQPPAPLSPTPQNIASARQSSYQFNPDSLIAFGNALSDAGASGQGVGQGISMGFKALDQRRMEAIKQQLANRELDLKQMEFTNIKPYELGRLEIDRDKNAIEREAMSKGVGSYASTVPSAVREYEYFMSLPESARSQYLNVKRSYLPSGTQLGVDGQVTPIPGLPGSLSDIEKAKSGGRKLGEGEGERQVTKESIQASIPKLEAAIGLMDKLADDATYTLAGQARDVVAKEVLGKTTQGGIASERYKANAKRILYPTLKDTFGAQFTEGEGDKLLETLGKPGNTPAEKKAILRDFINNKYLQAGVAPAGGYTPIPAQPSPSSGGSLPSGWSSYRRTK